MNTILTIAAWLLLGGAVVIGVVSFIRDGGFKELIRLSKED